MADMLGIQDRNAICLGSASQQEILSMGII